MKYKLLAVSTEKEVNIGDYVQALAASQFLPHKDGFIQRERLKEYNEGECKMIMNGWYMHHPEQWPPSNQINPLFVAFHINSSTKEALFTDESISYLKQFEPIGCRDMRTRDLLREHGVDAYFSACLTLTLGRTYKQEEKEDKCYFVDPFIPKKKRVYDEIENTLWLLAHPGLWSTIAQIMKKFPTRRRRRKKYIYVCRFYRAYSRLFTKETLLNAEYISQQNRDYITKFNSEEERLAEAERLIKKYAKAKLVVTARIHCALPCLGLGTPVILTDSTTQSRRNKCRMGGLHDLFHAISFHNGNKFTTNFPVHEEQKLCASNAPVNKDSWKAYADALVKTCQDFIAKK